MEMSKRLIHESKADSVREHDAADEPRDNGVIPGYTSELRESARLQDGESSSRDGSRLHEDTEEVNGEEGDMEDQGSSHDSNGCEDPEDAPLDLNLEALGHVATYYIPGNHGACTEVDALTEGTYHEIKLLKFEDGWTCIGRFTKENEHVAKTESELATMAHVKKHTTIPVPEVYFVNLNPEHIVGAPFVLMEYMRGRHLYQIWDGLSLDHKKGALSQIADVLAQLSRLQFDQIGSLKLDGSLGPICALEDEVPHRGPYASSLDFMTSAMPLTSECAESQSPEAALLNMQIKERIEAVLQTHAGDAGLNAPYRLLHGDFDAQNVLFTTSDNGSAPQLTAVIDWDYSRTCMLYELFEYPVFILDVHWSPELYEENKLLRQHFVRAIAACFPKGSADRKSVKRCFRMKSYVLQNFESMWVSGEDENQVDFVKRMLEEVKAGKAKAYEGKLDWEPDSEVESEPDE